MAIQHVDVIEGHVEGGHHGIRNAQVNCKADNSVRAWDGIAMIRLCKLTLILCVCQEQDYLLWDVKSLD